MAESCKVAGRKISQNSQENTHTGVSFLIKSQAEKFCKIHRKVPVLEPPF